MDTTNVTRNAMPTRSKADLERRVEELNRRALKLGLTPLTVSYGPTYVQELESGKGREVVDVTVSGEAPKLAGWTLVAVLDHDGPETVLSRVPGTDVNLDAYRDARPFCSHCNTTRRRLETFVVIHEDGRLAQVGRDCLADFLGGKSPAAVLFLAGWVREVGALDEEGGLFGGSSAPDAFNPIDFLAAASATIRIDGWLSRGKAYEMGARGRASADLAWELIALRPSNEEQRRWYAAREATAADVELATAALAWAQAQDPADASEYLANLGRTARKGWVKAKDAGILASAVPSFTKVREREIAAKNAPALLNEWFGTVGVRARKLRLTVLGVSYHESQFGTTTLVRFADAEGRRAKWWASGSRNFEQGAVVVIDATVKSHETWKDVRETVLTRATEWTAEGLALDEAKEAKKAARAAKKAARS